MRLRWALIILAALCGVYFAALHPWLMNWGATPAEQQMALPGDQLLPDAAHRFTRAITIRAPASTVWGWVVQIGQDRAGFYSNTWLENLTGANIHNADVIHPEWQQRALGDHVRLTRADLFPGAQTRIDVLDPERSIAYIPCPFVLQPIDGGTTRLLLREAAPSSLAWRAISALAWDPMHFVMEQRMLRGIKERAEGRPLVPGWIMWVARAGWILAGAGLLAVWLTRRRQRLWVLPPILIVLPVLWWTDDWNAALAGFLAIGITVLGALAFGRRWWPPFLMLAAAVALMLLLAPDAYVALGITLAIVGVVWPITSFQSSRRTSSQSYS